MLCTPLSCFIILFADVILAILIISALCIIAFDKECKALEDGEQEDFFLMMMEDNL